MGWQATEAPEDTRVAAAVTSPICGWMKLNGDAVWVAGIREGGGHSRLPWCDWGRCWISLE